MKIIKTLVTDICFIVVLFWLLASSLICLFFPVPVSAAVSFDWPSMPYVSNVPQNFSFTDSLEALSDNSSLSNVDLDSCRVFFKYNVNPQMYDIFVVPVDQIVDTECKTFFYYERTYSMVKFMSGYKTYCSYNAFSSTTFSPFTQFDNTSYGSVDTWGCVHVTDGLNSVPYLVIPFFVNMDRGGAYDSAELTGNLGTGFGDFSVPFDVVYDEISMPFFSLDVDGFYDWIINNNKISELPSYIVQSKLKSFIEFYKQFGSSNSFFTSKIGDWFSHMNIANQTLDNISVLKNSIDKLYHEYINYRSGSHAYWPSATKIQERSDIDTHTDNDNLTLVTDDSNDSLDVSILRDILRGVIAVSNNLIDGCSKIVTAINQLDFTVNVANDGGAGLDANSIWGSGDITESENYLALTAAFMDKGVDVSAAENMQINYLENATQRDSFTVSVVMPDQYVNGQFTEKTVTHTIDNTSKMYNTLILFRKLIAFAVVAYFAIRIRFELPNLIRGE